MRTRISVFISIIQAILLAAHGFVYATWRYFWGTPHSSAIATLVVLLLLSVSFVGASLLAFRYNNVAVRALYIAAATWLGAFGFFFCAALACWIVYGVATVFGTPLSSRSIAGFLFGAGVVASLYGVINAAWTRVNRIHRKTGEPARIMAWTCGRPGE